MGLFFIVLYECLAFVGVSKQFLMQLDNRYQRLTAAANQLFLYWNDPL